VNYGHLRLFGSAAFILASNVGGWILARGSADDVLAALRYAAVVVVLAVLLMPRRGPQPSATPASRGAPKRSHARFLITTALLHGSHAVLYAFGTMHWQSVGISEATIGGLWSMGVLAEIVLFALSGKAQRSLGSRGLLLCAAAGGVLRWPLLGVVTDASLLFVVQGLHALTFGALHLGAISYVQERVDQSATATVTSLYAASAGVGTGLMMLAAGPLFASLGPNAFIVMAALSAAGMVAAWAIHPAPNDALDTTDNGPSKP
jgi:PPP family 3-phenylpropionic acid transporter